MSFLDLYLPLLSNDVFSHDSGEFDGDYRPSPCLLEEDTTESKNLFRFIGFVMLKETIICPEKFSGEFLSLPFILDRMKMVFNLEEDFSLYEYSDECYFDSGISAKLDFEDAMVYDSSDFTDEEIVNVNNSNISFEDFPTSVDEFCCDSDRNGIPTVVEVFSDPCCNEVPSKSWGDDEITEFTVSGESVPICESLNSNFEVPIESITQLRTSYTSEELPDVDRVKLVDDDGITGFEKLINRNDWSLLKKLVPNLDIPTDAGVILSGIKPTSPEVIQFAVDELFPYHNLVDDGFFQELVECDDIALELDDCTFDLSHFSSWDKGKSGVNSTLMTGQTSTRQSTFREVALSVKKRNMNVPVLNTVLNVEDVSNKIVNKFFESVIDINKLVTLPDVISIGEVNYFTDYLKGKAIVDDDLYVDPICLVSMDKYRHMIKSQLKPVEDNSLSFERPLAATITFHDKGKVMSTSPIFLAAATRLFACLYDKISIPSGKHHQLFSLDACVFDSVNFWKEVDFSKFDKSQQELHHEIQRKIFIRLGVPNEFINTWFTSHCKSHISDACGLRFTTNFQRRTGDACTYLGNTIVTLAALCYVYDLKDPNVGMVVASGDDSLIGSFKSLDSSFEHLFSTLFNFEAKFPHNQPFICSKFLLTMPTHCGGRQVVAVPNPAKLLIKLGVKSMTSEKFDDWFQSWLDLIHYFDDNYLIEVVCSMASYRYIRRPAQFLIPAVLSLKSLFANKRKCRDILFPRLILDDSKRFSPGKFTNKFSDSKPRVRGKKKNK